MNLSAGQLFAGGYELLRPLGEGGMGVVWLARERSLEREEALKIMRPSESATRLLRFAREARALAALDHPSILPVLHTGTDEATGLPYLVTRAVLLAPSEIHRLCHDIFRCPHPRGLGGASPPGEPIGGSGDLPRPLSLADLLEGGKQLPEAAVLRIARDLADALSAAHAAGILHRDLKPSNILFDASGRAILSDFGLAKFLSSADRLASLSLDEAGQRKFLGSPAYAAPEQFRDGAPLTPALDWYAFGAILHEALAGERPRALRPLSSYAPDYLSRAWDPLLRGLLDPDPARRLQDPAAIRRALDRIARHPARPRRCRILRIAAIAAGLVAASLAVAFFATARILPRKAKAQPAPSVQRPTGNDRASDAPAPEPAAPMPPRSKSLWQGDNKAPLQLLNTVRLPVVDNLVADAFADADPAVRRLMDEGDAAWTASPRDVQAAESAWEEARRRLAEIIDPALLAFEKSGNPADAPSPALRVQFAVLSARVAWCANEKGRKTPGYMFSDSLTLIDPLVQADPARYAPLRSWLLAEFAYAKGMSGLFSEAFPLLRESLALLDFYTLRSWPGCARQEAFLLASLGAMRNAVGRTDESLDPTRRAIALAEEIAGGAPDSTMADFIAGCRYRAGEALRFQTRHQEAIEEYERALALWKPFGKGYDLTRAQVLGRIAGCHAAMNQDDRYLAATDEAIEILAPYAMRDPARHGHAYLIALRNRAQAHRALGDDVAAEADEKAADEFESRL